MLHGVRSFGVALTLALVSLTAAAAEDSGWHHVTRVTAAHGVTTVELDGVFPSGCAQSDHAFQITHTDTTGAAMHGTALAALLSGRELRAVFSGQCARGHNRATSVEIR